MKRKIYLFMLMVLSFSVFGCGERVKESTSTPSLESNQNIPDEEDPLTVSESVQAETELSEESSGNTEVSGDSTGVYPNSTEIVEINMGITEDILTFKVPTDYVLAGGYYDENGDEHAIDGLNSSTTTVGEAMKAGSFSSENHLAAFTMTSLNGDNTMITANFCTSDLTSWDELRACFPEAKELEDTSVPVISYHVEAFSGESLAIAIKLSDDVYIQIVYEGGLESEVGEEELAQRLYNLVTIK